MTAHDAIAIGWSRDTAGHWWGTGRRLVEAYRDNGHTSWWYRTGESAGCHAESEGAALEAAIDATPNARRLLAALREVDRLVAEVAALRALVPDVEAEWGVQAPYSHSSTRRYIGPRDADHDPIPALQAFATATPDAEPPVIWCVHAPWIAESRDRRWLGSVPVILESGESPDLATAQRDAEAAALRLGVIR